jgi:hypothetical protein
MPVGGEQIARMALEWVLNTNAWLSRYQIKIDV